MQVKKLGYNSCLNIRIMWKVQVKNINHGFVCNLQGQINDVWKHDLYQQAAGGFNKSRAGGEASGSGARLLISNLDFGVNDADIQV
jgi:hypothetical protein